MDDDRLDHSPVNQKKDDLEQPIIHLQKTPPISRSKKSKEEEVKKKPEMFFPDAAEVEEPTESEIE